MSHITLRRAAEADAQGILDCIAEAFEPYRSRYTPGAFDDTVMSPDAIKRRLTEMALLVAVDAGGAIVGTIGYNVPDHHEGHLRGMAIRSGHLGSGVGQRLLTAVEDELRLKKCVRVSLDTTRPLERAIRFYERNGYRRSGVIRDFYGMELIEYIKDLGLGA